MKLANRLEQRKVTASFSTDDPENLPGDHLENQTENQNENQDTNTAPGSS